MSTDKQEPIQKCFKSLEYIFKLIIQSRMLFSRATGGQYEDSFRRDLYSVFSALNNMMAIAMPSIISTQVRIFIFIILNLKLINVAGCVIAFNQCCIRITYRCLASGGSYKISCIIIRFFT